MVDINMKTPITYYGGKQRMLRHILPLIPPHEKYVEPFCGGAAVFFAKQPARLEIINDKNGEVVNFYRCCKENMPALKRKIDALLYARSIHARACRVYKYPQDYNKIDRAASFFALSAMSFGAIIGGTFSVAHNTHTVNSRRMYGKKKLFSYHLAARFDMATVECMDAVALIKKFDSPDAFFYVDPPYINCDQGHYGGYTESDFELLLQTLSQIKGKFLLSCYPSDLIKKYADKNKWNYREFSAFASATLSNGGRERIEVLSFNYDIENDEKSGGKNDIK